MKNVSREHIAWVDLLRILACFLVIVSHSCDAFVGQSDNNYTDFLSGSLIGSLVRPCVPLFVMISGLLLLPVNMEMTTFYSKRAKRLLLPFVFWALTLPVLYFLYVNYSGITIVSPFIDSADFTLGNTLQKMYTFVFNFNYDTTPLWYIYMLIGLYLFMPILSAWLVQAKKRDIKWFLRIWIVSMLLPYIQFVAPMLGYTGNGGNMGLLGICDWNVYGTFYYFSGFIGYVVLAYYLKKYPLQWSMGKTLQLAIPLFLLGYAITAAGYIYMHRFFPGSVAHTELVWLFTGINVFMMTYSVYIVFQKLKVSSNALMSKIAALTFGIYLCHFVFVQFAYDIVYPNIPVPAVFKILIIALLSFGISLFIIWLMSLNKYTRKVIM